MVSTLEEPRLRLGKYMHGPAREADRQLAVTGIEDVAVVADRVYSTINRRLGIENLLPGSGVPVEAHGVLGVVPLPVAGMDDDQEDVASVVPAFERDDVVHAVGVCDLACRRAQRRVVPAKIVYVGDHALHGRAEIVPDAEPVEAIVNTRADPWIPEAVDVPFRAHKEHGSAGKSHVKGPGESALR